MTDTITHTFAVPDISCEHCVDAIIKEVSVVENVEALTVNLEAKIVTVTGGAEAAIIAAIDQAGYDVDAG